MASVLGWIKKPVSLSGDDWSVALLTLLSVGVISTAFYALQFDRLEFLSGALLLGGASIVVGILLGFLFGIPRALQDDGAKASSDGGSRESSALRLQQNTNLEQISDWLTKILVGVGLTQLTSLPETLSKWGDYFAKSIAPPLTASAPVVADAILIFYATCGFLLGYIWTRLFFGNQLAEQYKKGLTSDLEVMAQKDARAIRVVNEYLNTSGSADAGQVIEAIKSASATTAATLFQQAESARRRGSNADPNDDEDSKDLDKLDRTIAVFEGLIAASVNDGDKHRYRAQLAYALKDKRNPDYARAAAELTEAIRERGTEAGYKLYELNRAFCLINLDPEFKAGRPTPPAAKDPIVRDLTAAVAEDYDLEDPDIENKSIPQWMKLNQIQIGPPISPPANAGQT